MKMQRSNHINRTMSLKRVCFVLPQELALWIIMIAAVALFWSIVGKVVYLLLDFLR